MPLETGTRVGVYEVTGKLGEGGMGEVYRAHDTTLDRDVALKVLSEAFTADPDRLARFQREAKVLASLNHPNIGGIHGLESAGETQALVLELIEGPTLADRIAEGPIASDEALTIAGQMAEALETAHEQGIVHRDLKPANVKLRPDGTVKVLDFGLAKAVTSDGSVSSGSNAPTMSITGATQMGMVVGTAAYMAPEQARGKSVDQRADVWAFGVVLLEMLTGQRVFHGDDVSLTLAKVLEGEPKWENLPNDVTPRVEKLLRRCLKKDPKQRIHAIGDARLALDGAFETAAIHSETSSASSENKFPFLQNPIGVSVGALVLLLLGGVVVWSVTGNMPDIERPVTRASIGLAADDTFSLPGRRVLGISPNGQYMAYQANFQLYLRAMDQMSGSPIRGTEGTGASNAGSSTAFSPDSEWVAFFHENQIKKVAVTGGAPIALGEAVRPWGLSWGDDDNVYFGQGTAGISMVAATGGISEVIVTVDEGEQAQSPELLPGGEWLLFTHLVPGAVSWSDSQIVMQSLVTGERRILVNGGTDGRYVPTGHIVYAQEGTLLAVRFDVETYEVTPGPVPLVEDVAMAGFTGSAHFSIADSGVLAYVSASSLGTDISRLDRVLALVDRTGRTERLDLPSNQYVGPRLSPNGSRLAVEAADGDESVIWTYELSGERAMQRLTVDGNSFRPLWSPDGERIAFASDRDGPISLYWRNSDGSGVPQRLTTAEEGTAHWPEAWSPDGQTLIYKIEKSNGGGWNLLINEMDLWTLSLDNPDDQQPFANESFPVLEIGGSFSPDGDWFAYTIGDGPANTYEIWAQPFPPTGERRRISQEFGVMPLWTQDGTELFYRPISGPGGVRLSLRSIGVSTTPSFTFSQEQDVAIGDFLSFPYYRSFDATPDATQMLVVLPADQTNTNEVSRAEINLVLNWFEELVDRVPVD